MPRLTIPKDNLPAGLISGALPLRFRIISESRNAMSAWSQTYLVYPQTDDESGDDFYVADHATASIISEKVADTERYRISVAWADPYNFPLYDIYIRWGVGTAFGEWQFLDTVSSKTYIFYSAADVIIGGVSMGVPEYLDLAVTRCTTSKHYDLEPGDLRTPITIFTTTHSYENGEYVSHPHKLG